jgi:Tfp pilus assembly protein PilN
MIRINLLPPEERPTQRTVKLPASKALIPLALFVLVAAPIGITMLHQGTTSAQLTQAVEEAREESIRLKPQIDRIHQLNRQTQELNHRIDVVAELDQASTYIVEVLDDMSQVMPKHMWLSRLEEDERRPRTMIVEGFTFTNLAVADFMVRLDKLGQFDDVVLVIIEEEVVEGRGVLNFEIEVRLRYAEKKEAHLEHS